ncbi:MAG: NAD(P)-dependent oxidoreductase [Methanobrevibacter sp.]|nr:NAD(P)-dependent oxidoreductase [Methanobrevibacter sp.]
MIIGFIGFGKVSKTLFDLIDSPEIDFATSLEGRSAKTIENIESSNIEVLESFEDVAIKSDVLVSATSPKSALSVAKKYGKHSNGIYLDLNNISPKTTLEIDNYVNCLVDGAIIGKIDSNNPVLYLSGEKIDDLKFLNEFLETKKISDNVGDVAILKMLRSVYTKSVSALLIESAEIAQKHDLKEEFFDILALTEGEDFKEKSLSRITNTLNNSKRKSEELEEIIDCFDDSDLIMVKAAFKKLNR